MDQVEGQNTDMVGGFMQTETRWYHLIAYFFGGAFLANTIPHLVNGMSGSPFQSPFATPPGQGLSSSTVNVVWGMFNLVVAYILVARVGRFELARRSTWLSWASRHCSRHACWHIGLGDFMGATSDEKRGTFRRSLTGFPENG